MQKYKYIAANLQNKKIKGTFIAKDEKDLAEQLAKQSLYLISAKIYSGNTPSAFFTLGTGKVPLSELTTFCRQFAIMLTTHIPLLECLDILKNQPFSGYFRKILDVIYDDVKSGLVLSEALKKHAKVFPDFFRSMVYVGEMSGRLELVFNSLADYYERDSAMRQKLRGAMAYPIMLILMTVGIAILMLTLVIPKFKEALADMDVPIEGITKVVYDISDFVTEWWQLLLSCVLILGIIIFLFLRTEKGKYTLDVLLFKLPLVRTIQINTVTARFASAFALLLSSGMDLTGAMEAAEVVITNRYMKKRFHLATDYVRHGMTLTNAFESINIFPSMMIKMITIGEKTNSLDDVLTRSCSFFNAQLEESFNSFSSKIQPIMIVIMGVVVGTMFIAVYSPMLSIMGAF
ncbi:MAG: type II secretion system F family protein [Clostridia bacterium]|nr:type II secretion system F family protein [Clostridia bacterium]